MGTTIGACMDEGNLQQSLPIHPPFKPGQYGYTENRCLIVEDGGDWLTDLKQPFSYLSL